MGLNIFNMVTTIFLLIFIVSLIFVLIVIVVVLKLMRTNVENKKSKLKENERMIASKIKDQEIPVGRHSQKIKYCAYCGIGTDWKALYCENCGSPLQN